MLLAEGDYIELVLFVGYAVWWSYTLRKGVHIQTRSLVLHFVFYGLAALYVWAMSFASLAMDNLTGGWDVFWVLLFPLFLPAVWLGNRYGERKVSVAQTDTGIWTYRGMAEIPFIWLGLFVIRLLLEDAFLGGFSVFLGTFGGGLPSGIPPLTFGVVMAIVTCLYFLSFGVVLGVTISIWSHHRYRTLGERGHPTMIFVISLMGGLFILLGGVVVAGTHDIFPPVTGPPAIILGVVGAISGLIVCLIALRFHTQPAAHPRAFGIVLVAISIQSWVTALIGGILIGFALTLLGGVLMLLWKPAPPPTAPPPPPVPESPFSAAKVS